MKQVVCAVWDSAVQGFAQPMFFQSTGQALRSFADEVNRVADDNALNKHPEDYEIHLRAHWDSEEGQFENEGRILARAVDLLQKRS